MSRFTVFSLVLLGGLIAAGAQAAAPDDGYRQGLQAFDSADYVKAREIWQAAALQGNADAANGLGILYESGFGVPRNIPNALAWFRAAAERGSLEGRNSLNRYQEVKAIKAPEQVMVERKSPSRVPQRNLFGGNYYVGIKFGLAQTDDNDGVITATPVQVEYDKGGSIAAVIGTSFNKMRAELEISHDRGEIRSFGFPLGSVSSNQDINATSVTTTLNYDFVNSTAYTPYLGIGAGATRFNGAQGSSTNLTFKAETGIGINVAERVVLVPSYSMLWINNDSNSLGNDVIHRFHIGTRYYF